MKFILNENTKFLLEERFILNEDTLTEASVADAVKDWVEDLKATFESTETVLKAYHTYAGGTKAAGRVKKLSQEFKTASEALEISLERPLAKISDPAEFPKIKAELGTYIRYLKQVPTVISETDETTTIFATIEARLIKALEQAVTKESWTNADIVQLNKSLTWVAENVNPLLEAGSGLSDSEIEEVKKTCEACINFIKTFNDTLDVDADFLEVTREEFNSFKTLVTTAIKAAQIEKSAGIIKAVQAKNERTIKSLVIRGLPTARTQIRALKDIYNQLTETDLVKNQSQVKADANKKHNLDSDMSAAEDKDDWKLKLAKAVNKLVVIEEFIYTTWPKAEDHNKILKIKETLLKECEAYGFGQDGQGGNPFISFISEVYLKYNIAPELYNVIHNLVVDDQVTADDLRGEGAMEHANLIFCRALYKLQANEIKVYIKKQHNLLKATAKPATFTTNAEMAYNIVYALTTATTGDATKQSSENLSLRPMTGVERLESKWTGAVSSTTTDNTKTTASTAALLNQISTRDEAIKVIAALTVKFGSNKKIINEANTCKEVKQLLNGSTTPAELIKLVAAVEQRYDLEAIKAAQALEVIQKIIASEDFKLTKE